MVVLALLLQVLAQDGGVVERILVAKDITVAGILLAGIILVTVGFLRGWVVTGSQYRKVQQDSERWMQLAWQAASTARSGVQTAHEAARTLRQVTENGATTTPAPAGDQQTMGPPFGGAG